MPIYEYQCGRCGHLIEILHGSDELKRPRCTECRGVMKKIISTAAFILKGSGWYVTDYPSESRKKGMESEKKSKGKKGDKEKTKDKKKKDKSTAPSTPKAKG